jgi:hypothetical protein
MRDLEAFMAAVRMAETGSFEGNYGARHYDEKGQLIVGAYGFLADQWPYMAQLSQVAGADWRDPQAQDWVAGHMMTLYQQRYGSWDLAAVAWIGGLRTADAVVMGNYTIEDFTNETLTNYVNTVMGNIESVPIDLPRVAPQVAMSPNGWVNPVAGPNEWSPGSFMYRRTASQRAAGKTSVHEGMDIYAARGTPVLSPVAGSVVGAGYGDKGGHFVKIKGDDGNTYYFAHMADTAKVANGARVRAGHHIGFVGNSGNARGTSPHLHFTMRASNGQLVNPSNYLNGATEPLPQAAAPSIASRAEKMAQLFEGMSNTIAGGERQDYRTMGQRIEEQEDITGATNEVIRDEPADEIDSIRTPTGVKGL